VAIKVLRGTMSADPATRQRFLREARAACAVRHPNVVEIHDVIELADGTPILVMELLEGETLASRLKREGVIPVGELAALMLPVVAAVGNAHQVGIVHRDLKPDNIFLARTDEPVEGLPFIVKLVDFGIAKIMEPPSTDGQASRPMGGPTREGTVIGTPNFMAPEQLAVGGAPGPLTDLWSLGACTFAAMTGRLPFEGDVLGDIVLKVCAAPLPVPSNLNPGVPAGFDAWFARACSRDPAKRFQTAEELAQALAGVCGLARLRVATLDEDQVQYVIRPKPDAVPMSSLPPPNSMSPRTALLAGLVLGIAMMIGVLGFLAWRERTAPGPNAPAPAPTESSSRP